MHALSLWCLMGSSGRSTVGLAGRGLSTVLVVLCAVACTSTPSEPPDPQLQQTQGAADPVYAYTSSDRLRVMRGSSQIAEMPLDQQASVRDAEWTADGSRLVAATTNQLVSIDARTGARVTADCVCDNVAIASGKLYTSSDNANELAVYDLTTLASRGTVKVDVGQARGLEAVDGAGDRLVTFQIIGGGARTESAVVVLDPATGSSTTVGNVIALADTAYTQRGWRGGPMFVYAATGSTGALTGVASIWSFDPTNPAKAVEITDRELREKTPDVAQNDWNSGRDNLWWAADGTLRTTAWTWSCTDSGRAGQPDCVNRIPHTQWRFDGTTWSMVDDRDLDTVQDIGSGAKLELSREPAPAVQDKQLTLVEGGEKRSVIGTDVRRLWTPGLARPAPKSHDQQMAERFAPLVWLHNAESDFPTDTSSFVRNSVLRFDHGKTCSDEGEPVATNLDEHTLGHDPGYSHNAGTFGDENGRCHHDGGETFHSHQPVDEAKAGGTGFYLDVDDNAHHGNQPGDNKQVNAPVYWEHYTKEGNARSAYIYWFFYAYDDYTANHEGDWERIAVQVEGDRPVGVTYWKHEIPACYVPWDGVEVSGDHPVTFSAQGAHGSYAREGNYPRYDGEQWGTDRTNRTFEWNTTRQVLSVKEQPWYGYRGHWGQIGLIGFTSGKEGPYPGRELPALTTDRCQDEPARTPEAFVGSWKSTQDVTDPSVSQPYNVAVKISAGTAGELVGDVTYPGTNCFGQWILMDATPDKMIVRETRRAALELACFKNGTIELTRTSTGLHYTYTNDDKPGTATAELIHSTTATPLPADHYRHDLPNTGKYYYYFESSDGHYSCGIDGAEAVCQGGTEPIPPRPASCHEGPSWGGGMFIDANQKVDFVCAGGLIFYPPNRAPEARDILPPGQAISALGFTCSAESSGIRCRHDTSGHGFYITPHTNERF